MTRPVVVYPDAELLTVEHLRDELPTYVATMPVVGTRKPNPMPAGGVVQVRINGGVELTPVSTIARLDFLVWHDTDQEAHDLCQLVRALVKTLHGAPVHRVEEFLGVVRSADPESDQPRYLCTLEIALRGSPLDALGS
jgi:hypothetical protein